MFCILTYFIRNMYESYAFLCASSRTSWSVNKSAFNSWFRFSFLYDLWRVVFGKYDKSLRSSASKTTGIWLTKESSKCTDHVLQSSQPITSRLNWQRTNNIASSSTNQNNEGRLKTSTDDSRFRLTLMMTAAKVVETSANVTTNSPSQDCTYDLVSHFFWLRRPACV